MSLSEQGINGQPLATKSTLNDSNSVNDRLESSGVVHLSKGKWKMLHLIWLRNVIKTKKTIKSAAVQFVQW